MKAKITKTEAINIYGAVVALLNLNEKYPAKFNYALFKNYNKLKTEVDTINTTNKKIVEAFVKETKEAKDKYLVADDKGKKSIPENKKPELEAELTALATKHKPAFDESEAFLKSKDDFDFHTVSIEHVPAIESAFMFTLEHIIKGE